MKIFSLLNGGPEKGRFVSLRKSHLSTFTADTTGQLDVFRHDGDSLGVDGAQVGVFEKTHQISFAGLCRAMTAELWKRKSVLKSWAISLTKRWNGNLRIKSSVDFW
jgi:hypothetical protein